MWLCKRVHDFILRSNEGNRLGMREQELYRVHLRCVRTAPPGYRHATCPGTLCRVTSERVLVPGCTLGSEYPLSEVAFAENAAEISGGEFVVALHTYSSYIGLCCNTQEECVQLLAAINAALHLYDTRK